VRKGTFSRGPGKTILCDSGGLQFGRDPSKWCGDETRDWAHRFLVANADEAITLDIPTRTVKPGSPFDSFRAALQTTVDSNAYFAKHRFGTTRFLSVLQGENAVEALTWYEAITTQPFEGWAFGGEMRKNYPHVVGIILRLINDGLLGKERNRLHFLGKSSLTNAVMLSALQKALSEKLGDPDFLITFDTSTPSQVSSTGQLFGYADLSPTSFTVRAYSPPTENAHADQHTPLPMTSSRISERLLVSDLIEPASTRQHGWDGLGNVFAIHHNIDALLRAIDDANAVMEMPSYLGMQFAPPGVIACYRALRTMFGQADPLRHVLGYRADFAKL